MTALPKPLPRVGKRSLRWQKHHEQSRAAVLRRSGGRCEGCAARNVPLDWAHLAGRGNKGIGEPWCSSPDLCAALCRNCHNAIDRNLNVALQEELRWDAFERLATPLQRAERIHIRITSGRALDAIRETVRMLEKAEVSHE